MKAPSTKQLTILLTFVSVAALGNISAPPQPKSGNIAGQNSFGQISVLSENLDIDLTGLALGQNVLIRATYKIYVPEFMTSLDLVFIANNLARAGYSVQIDGRSPAYFAKEYAEIPKAWLPPDSVLAFNSKIPFNYRKEGLVSFTIDRLTPGEHVLEVFYEAEAGEWYDSDGLSVTRSFVYILKPYEGWKNFRNLTLNVSLPAGWEYVSNLKMTGDSQKITGFWKELPAHHLAVTLRPKETKAVIGSVLFVILSGAFAVFVLLKWTGAAVKRSLRSRSPKILLTINALLVSFAAGVFAYFLYFKEAEVKNYLLDNHLNPLYTYGSSYAVFAFPVVWFLALILVAGATFYFWKKHKAEF